MFAHEYLPISGHANSGRLDECEARLSLETSNMSTLSYHFLWFPSMFHAVQ
jgi:hypothetical protein